MNRFHEEVRCIKCNDAFVPVTYAMAGNDYCPSCREPVANRLVKAKLDAEKVFSKIALNEWDAKEDAQKFANGLEKEQIDIDKRRYR